MEVKCKGNTQITQMEENKKCHRVIRLCKKKIEFEPIFATTGLHVLTFTPLTPSLALRLEHKLAAKAEGQIVIKTFALAKYFGLW